MEGISLPNPLSCVSVLDCLCSIADLVFAIALPIALFILMVGAVLLLTSAGDPQRITRGKEAMLWAVIGLVVMLVALGLPQVIVAGLGGSGVPACTGSGYCDRSVAEDCREETTGTPCTYMGVPGTCQIIGDPDALNTDCGCF